ncbi:MAG TPA: mannose-1-phosphate guanylyltransferase/mannose-6-phosphate isomerase [Coriobacteriia bacterium]|nr:mannose-1-phosphate guanylyltransferase/mannose-6-phosphate isomerase [Coriobacteriia bacterium]
MAAPLPHLYACILAGGSGQRFWPLSRELNPKQLLSIFGTESLIAQAIHRIAPFVANADGVWIVTNERLFDELRNHLTAQPDPDLHHVRYLKEPLARNTAPAIALAAASMVAEDPDAVMIVLPSDHLLEGGQLWADCIESAVKLAEAGHLVTIGIRPTRAETGYGYIKADEQLAEYAVGEAMPHRAERFVEKPDATTAESYVESGEYFWNAGIFVMRADALLSELSALTEDGAKIAASVREIAAMAPEDRNGAEALDLFAALPAISVDYAVMELSNRVVVIPASLDWNDVGSLQALESIAEPDGHGNVRSGRGIDIDSYDSIIYSGGRLVATLGVRDMIVVDTSDATLVLPKDRAQDVRRVFDALKASGAPEVTQPKVSLRPWGSWEVLLSAPRYQMKLVEVKPGAKLSLQRHHHRAEHWIVVAGTAMVTRGDERVEVHVNESVFIPIGETHRLENRGTVPLQVIEVQVGEYLGEDDIVRLEDDWDRS